MGKSISHIHVWVNLHSCCFVYGGALLAQLVECQNLDCKVVGSNLSWDMVCVLEQEKNNIKMATVHRLVKNRK